MKMHLKLEASDYVITGIRVKLDPTTKANSTTSIKLLNRTVKVLKNKGPIFTDIGLCDIEVLYTHINGMEVEFLTDDVKNNPIRLYNVEVFIQSKKDFNFKEKMKLL
jgi:hypothetical protein